MKKKILFVAHMDSHIANFHLPYLKWFKEQGYETHVASNNLEKTTEILNCDYKHQVDFKRSPFSLANFKIYHSFKNIIKENDFALIHAHTPMGGLFARLAFRKLKKPVIYTAHGFHFLKGGSTLSWLIFYPIEKWLSRYTSEIITINNEDYNLAKSKFHKNCNVSLVHGVGVDLKQYSTIKSMEKEELRKAVDLQNSDFVILYVGEQTKGKNQGFLINMMTSITEKYNNVKLLLVGYGKEKEKYHNLIEKLNLTKSIIQLGFRTDIVGLNNIADLVVSTSHREGLPKSLLEALAIGKPILASDIRGNRDLINHGENGYLYSSNNKEEFLKLFDELYNSEDLREKFSSNARKKSLDFDIDKVLKEVTNIYKNYLIKEDEND